MSLKYAAKELLVRKHRTIVNCIGIAVSVALVISLYSLSNAYKEAVRKPFAESGVDLVLEKPKTGNSSNKKSGVILPDYAMSITADEVEKVKGIEGIDGISTSLQVWSFDKGNFKVIAGIDTDNPPIGLTMFKDWVNEGRFFTSEETGVAVVEKHYAKYYSLKVDDNVEISGKSFRIIGTVETKEGSQLSAPNLFLPINDVRQLTGVNDGDVNGIYIRLKSAADTSMIADKINKVVSGLKTSSSDSSLSLADSLFSLSEKFTWLISLIVILVAAFLIFKTVSSNILERIKEIGIMKAVGWTSGNIRKQLTLEMTIQGIIGGVLGAVTGIVISLGLSLIKVNAPLPWQGSPVPGSVGTAAGSADLIPLQVNISPVFILITLAVTLIITLLCGVLASNRSIKIKPSEALRAV